MADQTLVVLPLLLLIAFVSAAERPSCIWNCRDKDVANKRHPDGDYHSCDPMHSCHTFITCTNGRTLVRDCPDGTVWDDKLEQCEHNSTTCDQKPNIIYVMADDAGYCDVGYMKDQFDCTGANAQTPFLDKLANCKEKSRILTNHYMMPGCTPSRHAFMTGRNPYNSMMQHFILPSNDPHCTPTNIKFLPEHLKDQGYKTHLTGKWHLGFCKEECIPSSRGFDTFYGLWTGMADQYTHETQPPDIKYYDFRDGVVLDKSASGTHSTTLFTDRAVQRINEHDKYDPMFLFVAYKAPHSPLQVPQKYLDMLGHVEDEERKKVLAMMIQLDDGVKEIVDALIENGMWENTFFIFSSDNGGDVTEHQYNGPMRGGKGTLYEGGTRTPAFVYGKMLDVTSENHVSHGLMHVTDWFATIVSLAGGNPDEVSVDGIDQKDMLLDGDASHRTKMVYNIDMEAPFLLFGQAAVRDGNYKLIWGFAGTYEGWGWNVTVFDVYPDYLETFPPAQQIPEMSGMRTFAIIQRETFQLDSNGTVTVGIPGVVKLFDLDADPYEMNNLAEDPTKSDIVEALKQEIIRIVRNEYVAPQPLHLADWTVQAQSVLEDGDAWNTGWCNDVKIEIPTV